MLTNSIQKVSFGNLYRGETLYNLSPLEAKKARIMERRMIKHNFDTKSNVDLFLQYNKKKGFYAVIFSKKQGFSYAKNNTCIISHNKNQFQNFAQWLNNWDKFYAPKKLNFFQRILKNIF